MVKPAEYILISVNSKMFRFSSQMIQTKSLCTLFPSLPVGNGGFKGICITQKRIGKKRTPSITQNSMILCISQFSAKIHC